MKRLFRKLGNLSLPPALKVFLWRLGGFKIGNGCGFDPSVKINAKGFEVKDHSSFGKGTYFLGQKNIVFGEFVTVGRFCSFEGKENLKVGDNCFIGNGSVINTYEDVNIGKNTAIAGNGVQIWTHSTWMQEVDNYNIKNKSGAVSVGEDCYVGTRSLVLQGVIIGDKTVIGAGSIVTKDIPKNSLAIGVPAKVTGKVEKKPRGFKESVKVISEFLERQGHKINHKRVEFVWGKGVLGSKSVFDLKDRVCAVRNKEGVKIRKLLNEYIVRFTEVKQ